MTQLETTQATPSPAFVAALRKALRPLVHLMLARGITYGYVAELLKSLMVEVAVKDFQLTAKETTDSRVSLLTGVHRKDVYRLRHAAPAEGDNMPAVVPLGAQLVAQWQGQAAYLDEQGQPLPLPRYVSEGGAQSFEGLVAGVNSDIRSRAVLDEWLRLGLVSLDAERRVCLNTQAFVPPEGFDDKAFYFGHNLHDHAAAAAHNLQGHEPPFMERSVHYGGLDADAIKRLSEQAQKLGMQALLAVNKTALGAIEKAQSAGQLESPGQPGQINQPNQRMTFGIYFYAAPDEPTTPSAASAPGRADETPR